jgi:hypothetical protein
VKDSPAIVVVKPPSVASVEKSVASLGRMFVPEVAWFAVG